MRSLQGDSAHVIANERQWVAINCCEVLLFVLICVELVAVAEAIEEDRARINRADC